MFRFTIRELALVMVIVALAVGWWADRRRLTTMANEQGLWLYDALVRLDQHGETMKLDADGTYRIYRRTGPESQR